jgi:uncharacterized repeat protein (TIGR01451 family)
MLSLTTHRIRPTLLVAAGVLSALALAPAAQADVSASALGDLGVAVSTPGPVLSGVATTYTLSVTNNSPAEFDSVLSTGSLSNGMTLNGFGLNDNCGRSNTNTQGILRGPVFSCVLGTGGSVSAGQTFPPGNILAPGATTSWSFTATATKPGTYTAHVTGSGLFSFGNPLGNGRSNAVDLTIPVGQGPAGGGGGGGGGGGVPAPTDAADIALTGSASNGSPAFGSPFSYKFQAKNNGKSDAATVTLDIRCRPPSWAQASRRTPVRARSTRPRTAFTATSARSQRVSRRPSRSTRPRRPSRAR